MARPFRSTLVGVLALALIFPAGIAWAQPDPLPPAQGGPPITVMTRNLYLGAELGPIFAAESPAELVGLQEVSLWRTSDVPSVPAIRDAQAYELLAGPLDTDLSVVLVADFNSNAVGGVAYGTLIGGGFTDAWSVANPDDPGLTCCQAADLLNEESRPATRIDLILVRGGLRVRDATLLGADPPDRTPSGLWPSDHVGVAARLMLLAR